MKSNETEEVAKLGPREPDPDDDPTHDAPGLDPEIDSDDQSGLA